MLAARDTQHTAVKVAVVAWLITSIFYFLQYVMRSAPAVMMPELGTAFGISAASLASLVGLFYYGYAPFSLVAGVAIDQLGPRAAVPAGAALMGLGSLLFATGIVGAAGAGRFLQGAGGVFALIGAVCIVTMNFPASRAATLIGATQMFGMAGGSAGQFLVGPAIASGLAWNQFWLLMGLVGLAIAGLLFFFIPSADSSRQKTPAGTWAAASATAIGAVFRNPQSILCGSIAGLMFLPTTVFDMVWGVRFLQEAHDLPYSVAVLRSAAVPFGWIIGCPLLGLLSDRIGRRKPVIIGSAVALFACLGLILFTTPDTFPPYSLGLLAGIASGGAMLPYTVIKEANRPEHGGTATGVINFINFSLSAVAGPLLGFVLASASDGGTRELTHYQAAFTPLLGGIGLAIIFALFLRETGPARLSASRSGAQKSTHELPSERGTLPIR